MSEEQRAKSLTEALQDYSSEGLAIIASEPSRLIRMTNYVVVAFLCAGVAWSFFGKADVIVTANGALVPDSDVRRVYTPVDGELVDIYVSAGVPVSRGDVIARINARDAIQAATTALEARLKLTRVEREYQDFPLRRALLQSKATALKAKLDIEQGEQEKRITEGMAKLAGVQRAKLDEARAKLENAKRDLGTAQLEVEQYERLFNMPGGGGVSANQVEKKRNVYLDATSKVRLAEAKLSELDFQLSRAIARADTSVASGEQKLAELRFKYETALRTIKQQADKIDFQLRSARLAAESAMRVSFENIDEENFLRILAPVSGMVTEVPLAQRGDKIRSSTPLASIAPAGAEPILKVEIPEADRGFLELGQPAKMKFNAFPYQRYGLIHGTLEYISPTAESQKRSQGYVYQGRIRLQSHTINSSEGERPLHYGMGAVAEIVVRERRLIDLALEPFRRL